MISARACFKDSFEISMSAIMGAGFGFAWMVGLGEKAEIIEPVDVRQQMVKHLQKMLEAYKNEVDAIEEEKQKKAVARRRKKTD